MALPHLEVQVRARGAARLADGGDPLAGAHGLSLRDEQLRAVRVHGEQIARVLEHDDRVLDWVRQVHATSTLTTSVCTGALLLAKAGLLAGRRATTHWAGLDLLASIDPTIRVQRDARVVEDGVVTSAGVSAGIDMAFTLVERLCGKGVADETAHYIEYPRSRDVSKYQNAV